MNGTDDLQVLFLPRYQRLGSSSRLRCYQYLPGLEACGIRGRVFPLLSDEYVTSLYMGKSRPHAGILAGYARRVLECIRNRPVDLVWIERELLPWVPGCVERAVAGVLNAPYVLDLDDAVFHRYDLHRRPSVRALLGGKVDGLMRRAAMVTVGNDYLGARASAAGATCVEYLPTVVDAARYQVSQTRRPGEVSIGWIGTPNTVGNLELVHEALAAVSAKENVRLVVIGAELRGWDGIRVESVGWSEASEAALVGELDIGIMPLAEGPWERGKCGYKLIQYMAAGIPVIASPVGANVKIVQDGVNGFLADSVGEWIRTFEALVGSAQLRAEMGRRGRESVVANYNLEQSGKRLAMLLRRAAGRSE
jgi:glycosyltransferase involved in cell wall biosynthesis